MKHAFKLTLALALALTALILGACGDSDESGGTTDAGNTTAPKADTTAPAGEQKPESSLPTIVVRNGEPVDGVLELEYDAGDQVRFRVESDVADEVHVHGYDVEKAVPAGQAVTLSFPADIEGIFEVELHGSEQQIAELRVNP